MCNGVPIGHEVFEGNRVDKKTVKEILKDLKEKFEIGRCIFVGDRGLVTKENLEEIERHGFDSIIALRKRRNAEVKEIVLDATPHVYCIEGKELWWREVRTVEGIRYIVCRNPDLEFQFYSPHSFRFIPHLFSVLNYRTHPEKMSIIL
ncbi:MAG: transposase [Nitrospira sp.]|nr:transposase [Nitrospira sp.]